MVTDSVTYDTTYKDTEHTADVILRLYVGSARPTDTPCLDWALNNPWSLVLCDNRTLDAWRGVEGGHHVRPLLMFREGRFPAAYKDSSGTYHPWTNREETAPRVAGGGGGQPHTDCPGGHSDIINLSPPEVQHR